MAVRQIFLPALNDTFSRSYSVEYRPFNGFSLSQKRKSVASLHDAYRQLYPDHKILEVSSASNEDLGIRLSAFHLLKEVSSLNKKIPVECLFQGGKIYEHGGPYLDLYEATPSQAKRDPRKNESGRVIGFTFEGKTFPTEPRTLFYDYLYLSALKENSDLSEQLLNYDGFTDIFFDPNKAFNCQAQTCARYVSLVRQNKLDEYLKQIEEDLN